jgi:hypothetical protein
MVKKNKNIPKKLQTVLEKLTDAWNDKENHKFISILIIENLDKKGGTLVLNESVSKKEIKSASSIVKDGYIAITTNTKTNKVIEQKFMSKKDAEIIKRNKHLEQLEKESFLVPDEESEMIQIG